MNAGEFISYHVSIVFCQVNRCLVILWYNINNCYVRHNIFTSSLSLLSFLSFLCKNLCYCNTVHLCLFVYLSLYLFINVHINNNINIYFHNHYANLKPPLSYKSPWLPLFKSLPLPLSLNIYLYLTLNLYLTLHSSSTQYWITLLSKNVRL